MTTSRTFVRAIVAIAVICTFLSPSLVLAGTTGSISGQVVNDSGKPVAGALVRATSPSQNASTTSDSSGHFAFLALAPDTYVVSAEKQGVTAGKFVREKKQGWCDKN